MSCLVSLVLADENGLCSFYKVNDRDEVFWHLNIYFQLVTYILSFSVDFCILVADSDRSDICKEVLISYVQYGYVVMCLIWMSCTEKEL